MKTLIIYASKKGTVKTCAGKIQRGVKGETEVLDFKGAQGKDLRGYDNIILGTPVYAGSLDKEFKAFVTGNEVLLKEKRTFLYVGCMDQSQMDRYLSSNLTPEQYHLFKKVICCGGALYFSKMNFFERGMIKMIVNSQNEKTGNGEKVDGKKDIENFDQKQMDALINEVNRG